MIYGSVLAGSIFSILALWLPILVGPAVLFFSIAAYLSYVRFRFSPSGGDIQNLVRGLVLSNLVWDGRGTALDIGCGNGALAIMLAKRYPDANVVAIDFWGKRWEYSREVCENNARVEDVDSRVKFQKASAASLPFDEEHFDVVVSNFVFHEVSGVEDKRDLIREALRVVRRGGSFSFQDEFLMSKIYGDPEDLIDTIRSWGVEEAELVRTCDADFIPASLKVPMFLGTIAIIAGRK